MLHFSAIESGDILAPQFWEVYGDYWVDGRQVRGAICVGGAFWLSSKAEEFDREVGFLDQLSRQQHYNDVAHFKCDGSFHAGVNPDLGVGYPTSFVNLANNRKVGHVVTGRYAYTIVFPVVGNAQSIRVVLCWTTKVNNKTVLNTSLISVEIWIPQLRADVSPSAAYCHYQSGSSFYQTVVVPRSFSVWGCEVENPYFGSQSDIPQWLSGVCERYISLADAELRTARFYWVDLRPKHCDGGNIPPPPELSLPKDFEFWGVDKIFPKEDRNPNWADMARDAYQDLGDFQGNGVALAHDVLSMKEGVLSTLETIKSLGSGKIKAVAALFLSFHYGWKLFVMDLRELATTLSKIDYRIKRCQSVEVWSQRSAHYVARYQVDYDPFAQVQNLLDELILRFDLELHSSQAWDMIPYSFVVDWFIKVGDTLTSLDNYMRLQRRHRVVAAGRSIKCSKTVDQKLIKVQDYWIGQATATFYTRRYGKLIQPSLLPSVTENVSVQHFIEAGALVVAAY